MSSPTKKRKRSTANAKAPAPAQPPRGLEYFFSRQAERRVAAAGGGFSVTETETGSVSATDALNDTAVGTPDAPDAPEDADPEIRQLRADEALARRLQAEWDAETAPAGDAAAEAGEDTAVLTPPPSGSTADASVTATLPLDESPLVFDPGRYIPALRQEWAAAADSDRESNDASPAPYALLTRCFVLVSATQSRIRIVDTLTNCLRVLVEADAASLRPAVWLATNAIGPPYVPGRELGLGGAAIGRALRQACGLDARALRALYQKYGDPGDVAFAAWGGAGGKRQGGLGLFGQKRRPPLSIAGVYQALVRVAACQGAGRVEAKQRIVDRLLQDARGAEESRFLVRTLGQHLRIGAVQTTLLVALARAFLLSRPGGPTPDVGALAGLSKDARMAVYARAEETVKACFAQRPSYDDLVAALCAVGVGNADASAELLRRCRLAVHTPLRPMLGAITRDLSALLAQLQGRGAFACEYKYDGQRAQVHWSGGDRQQVSIFSRHLECMTDQYPDLVALIPEIVDDTVTSFVLEGEVVAVDRATGALRPFQALAGRARKAVALGSVAVDVCLFAFDLMLLNGRALLDQPLRARRALLRAHFRPVPGRFAWVTSTDVEAGAAADAGDAAADDVAAFFQRATASRCEGIMVKLLDGEADGPEITTRKKLFATYEPDKRLESWLKVKKDYAATADTLDLVPVAAWHGSGRKAAWWSPILLAVRNEDSGVLEAVTKCMSGFTDVFYKANRAFYDDGDDNTNTRRQKPSFVAYSGPPPDVWFEPQEVWETAFADITLSPTYTAALGLAGDADRGLSLRFPRFVRKREDKGIDEASTSAFLADLYWKQGE